MVYWRQTRNDVTIDSLKVFSHIRQIDSILPCASTVIDHRGSQDVVRTSLPHSVAIFFITF